MPHCSMRADFNSLPDSICGGADVHPETIAEIQAPKTFELPFQLFKLGIRRYRLRKGHFHLSPFLLPVKLQLAQHALKPVRLDNMWNASN